MERVPPTMEVNKEPDTIREMVPPLTPALDENKTRKKKQRNSLCNGELLAQHSNEQAKLLTAFVMLTSAKTSCWKLNKKK